MKVKLLMLVCTVSVLSVSAQELTNDIAAKRAYYQKERAELMATRKANESASHKERIAILERAEQCIQAAKTKEAYRACEEKEKVEREAFHQKDKSKRDANHAKAEALKKQRDADKETIKAKRESHKSMQ